MHYLDLQQLFYGSIIMNKFSYFISMKQNGLFAWTVSVNKSLISMTGMKII